MVAAVKSVRFSMWVKESFRVPPEGVRYLTDSSAVLGMLKIHIVRKIQ